MNKELYFEKIRLHVLSIQIKYLFPPTDFISLTVEISGNISAKVMQYVQYKYL